ncbi:MAG TPA: GAF domain-containing protein [Thermoanaerobaculia bacterium]|nr:GAF domain-containing protein [Thermoanaerobaculia bacterium]
MPDPSATYDAVISAGLELVDGDRGSLMLLDESLGALVIRSQQGLPEHIAHEARVTLGEGVAGWVAEHDQAVLLQGRASADGRFSPGENLPVQSSLSVPLRAHGEVLGVLNLGQVRGSHETALDESDKRLAQVFAQHASISVKYAALWELVQRRGH